MAFQVDITEPALADAEDYVRLIREVRKQPEAAERWFRGLVRAIYSIDEIRRLVHFSHRIIFRVERDRNGVVVFRVYHGSRQVLAEGDLL